MRHASYLSSSMVVKLGSWMQPLSRCWRVFNAKLVTGSSTYQSTTLKKSGETRIAVTLGSYTHSDPQTHFPCKIACQHRGHHQQPHFQLPSNHGCIIVQQCQMLESELNSDVLAMCLKNPQDAPAIVKSMRTDIKKV